MPGLPPLPAALTRWLPRLLAPLCLIMSLAPATPGLAQQIAAMPTESVHHFTLANGLQVVVIPDARIPVVTHMIWYKVGSADEERGKSGIAHFLEHLMFKGTKANGFGVFSKAVAAWGGQENAFTSTDYTAYFQRIDKTQLKAMMAFEADRMTNLILTDEQVVPERNVVLEERRMRTDNDPSARLSEQISASLYLNHPYGIPVIGWEHEIRQLNRDDALAFYQRHYAPNNAVLVIAGDTTPEEVKAIAEETYGRIPANAAVTRRQRPQDPPPAAARQVTLADARVAQPSLQRSYLAPSVRTATPGESEALELLSHIAGSGASSRLFKALVTDQGLASNAGAYYQATAIDTSRFVVYATPRPDTSLPKLEAALDKVLAEIVAGGVTAEELKRAQVRLVADSVYAQDSQASLARAYGSALVTGGTIEEVRDWPKRVATVTVEQVKAAAAKVLDKRASVTGYLVKEATP